MGGRGGEGGDRGKGGEDKYMHGPTHVAIRPIRETTNQTWRLGGKSLQQRLQKVPLLTRGEMRRLYLINGMDNGLEDAMEQ